MPKGHTPHPNSRKYNIPGTGQQTKKEKLSKAEKDKKSENDELRTPRCVICKMPRGGWTYPIHNHCIKRKPNDGIITRRAYNG